MPKGPKGQNHLTDGAAINAVRLMADKDPNAAALGRKGGVARAIALSPEERSDIARNAAAKRWRKPPAGKTAG